MASSASFTTIIALAALPHRDVAEDILRRLAADVEPLINTHTGWRPIPQLFEIYPSANLGPRGAPLPPSLERIRGRLGGYTHPGKEICMVLRDESRADTFIVYAQLLDTFLHELAHQSYGNHGPGFSKLWTTLQQEYLLHKSRGLLGAPTSRGAGARAAAWGIDSVSYGVGIPTSGAFRVNTQTGGERYSGAFHLAPGMGGKAATKAHFGALSALSAGFKLEDGGGGGGSGSGSGSGGGGGAAAFYGSGRVLGSGARVAGSALPPPGAAAAAAGGRSGDDESTPPIRIYHH